jgi:type VI secretion system protein ImpF
MAQDDIATDLKMPALLDRLLDCGPFGAPGRHQTDSRWQEDWARNRSNLGSSLRDICRLMSKDLQLLLSSRARAPDDIVYDYPLVAKSVVNFGIRIPVGQNITPKLASEIEESIAGAIRTFEPRVMPETLTVSYDPDREFQVESGIPVDIRCDIFPLPLPESLVIHTIIKPDAGTCNIQEEGRR